MPDDNDVSADLPQDESSDEEDDLEDEDGEDSDETEDADATDGDESSDGDLDGGSGAGDEGETPKPEVTKPTGKDVLELLASDPEAQTLMASTLQQIMQENARSADAQAQAKEFQDLIDKGDYAEVGRRIVERTQSSAAREQVADEVLKEVFQPVYADIFAQPEMKELTTEDKEALAPAKFDSDAHYVRALEGFLQTKRFNKAVEAEVEKRIKTRDEASGNRETARTARTKSPAATASAVGATTGRSSSGARISAGLQHLFAGAGGTDAYDGDDD